MTWRSWGWVTPGHATYYEVSPAMRSAAVEAGAAGSCPVNLWSATAMPGPRRRPPPGLALPSRN